MLCCHIAKAGGYMQSILEMLFDLPGFGDRRACVPGSHRRTITLGETVLR